MWRGGSSTFHAFDSGNCIPAQPWPCTIHLYQGQHSTGCECLYWNKCMGLESWVAIVAAFPYWKNLVRSSQKQSRFLVRFLRVCFKTLEYFLQDLMRFSNTYLPSFSQGSCKILSQSYKILSGMLSYSGTTLSRVFQDSCKFISPQVLLRFL